MGVLARIDSIRPSRIRTRNLRSGELDTLRQIMSPFLRTYGLRLTSVTKEALAPVATHPQAQSGFLQKELRYPLTLMHGLGSAAVAVSGMGLGKNDVNKRMVD
ncbi:MAG: hypothetical protein KJ732_03725, partial [Candidatus Margulisbacteria bacterium]|nr:hypothetical protein [Candidatus Margulisiibacteriota bacterium]